MPKTRQSNIELLRIVMILAIIILHYCNQSMGGLLGHVTSGTFPYYLAHLVESLTIIAVNSFILITGYFSGNKQSVKINKIVRLYLIMVFYGLVLTIIGGILTERSLTNPHFLILMVENMASQWFVVTYGILYLLIPYINKLLSLLNKRELRILILINLLFFSLWPTFFTTITVKDGGYGIINFLLLYIIGFYIKKYCDVDVNKPMCIVIYITMAVIVTVFSMFVGRAWNYNSIFNIIGSIAIFILFKSLRIPHSKLINRLASYTFMVYIIDVNTPFNLVLYRRIFYSNDYWNSNQMIINLLISTIGIYVICLAIEFCRRLLFGKAETWLLNHIHHEIIVR